jgi:hypothetical protein
VSRWAEAFNAIEAPIRADTLDTVDSVVGLDALPLASETSPADTVPSHSVNRVQCVSPNREIDIEVGGSPDRAVLQRLPSWADPAALPSHGC